MRLSGPISLSAPRPARRSRRFPAPAGGVSAPVGELDRPRSDLIRLNPTKSSNSGHPPASPPVAAIPLDRRRRCPAIFAKRTQTIFGATVCGCRASGQFSRGQLAKRTHFAGGVCSQFPPARLVAQAFEPAVSPTFSRRGAAVSRTVRQSEFGRLENRRNGRLESQRYHPAATESAAGKD
jgi:hypothetical protein